MSHIELYCGRTQFNGNGIEVDYTAPMGNKIERGFKMSYLKWLKQFDNIIIYIGDGLSDREAALKCRLRLHYRLFGQIVE